MQPLFGRQNRPGSRAVMTRTLLNSFGAPFLTGTAESRPTAPQNECATDFPSTNKKSARSMIILSQQTGTAITRAEIAVVEVAKLHANYARKSSQRDG